MFPKIRAKLTDRPALQATLVLIFWTFASRGLGFVRTAFVGRLPTVEADLFNTGLNLQSDITTIFILGSIVIATLPQISKLNEQDKQAGTDHANRYISWCMLVISGGLALLCVAAIIFTPQILQFSNPNIYNSFQDQGVLAEFILFNRIVLFSPVIFALKSILGVFLNVKKDFFVYSLEGVLYNTGLVIGLAVLYRFFGILGPAYGVIIGLVAVLLAFGYQAWRLGIRTNLEWFEGLGPILGQTLILYLPRLLVYSNIRAAERIVSLVALEANGQISALQYALDIQGIFLGIVAAVGTVFLPNLTEILFQRGQGTVFWRHLGKYLRISVVMSLVGTVVTIAGTPLAIVLFQLIAQVRMDSFLARPENVQLVILLTTICAVTLVFQSIAEILNRYFTALERVWQPVLISLLGNGVAVLISFQFRNTLGPAVSSAVGFSLNSAILCFLGGAFVYHDWCRTKAVSTA